MESVGHFMTKGGQKALSSTPRHGLQDPGAPEWGEDFPRTLSGLGAMLALEPRALDT